MTDQSEAYTDVVELCAILQCLGFSVKSLDCSDGNVSQSETATRTVVINCQTSGLHVVLETPSVNCSCPATHEQQNSGSWQVSGVSGGRLLEKEFGSSILGSLPKPHRERLTKELRDILRCIKVQNDPDPEKIKDESMSASELKTPEKIHLDVKTDTPTRYRSLDTLTSSKAAEQQLPPPGPLKRAYLVSDSEGDHTKTDKPTDQKVMCHREGTFTMPTPPEGNLKHRNKTSSPIHPSTAPQSSMMDKLVAAEKRAKDLYNILSSITSEYSEDKDDSSVSSLALDVSKISLIKGAEFINPQFASSPNLSGVLPSDAFTKNRLKRFESASTSNLAVKPATEGKVSRLRRISPNIFKKKERPSANIETKHPETQDGKSKLTTLFKPRIVTPIRTYKASPAATTTAPSASPNPSSSRTKLSYIHIKSTIPKPTVKK